MISFLKFSHIFLIEITLPVFSGTPSLFDTKAHHSLASLPLNGKITFSNSYMITVIIIILLIHFFRFKINKNVLILKALKFGKVFHVWTKVCTYPIKTLYSAFPLFYDFIMLKYLIISLHHFIKLNIKTPSSHVDWQNQNNSRSFSSSLQLLSFIFFFPLKSTV